MRTIANWIARHLRITVSVVGLAAVVIAIGAVVQSGADRGASSPVLSYQFDEATGKWVMATESFGMRPGPGLGSPRSTNTVIIRVRKADPVKDITIENALVAGGSDPIIEISGQANGSGTQGHLNIGALSFVGVDAKRLRIVATEAVMVSTTNAVDKDDELDMNVTTVGVVVVSQGGMTKFTIGSTNPDGPTGGVRIDRIRILGPEGDTGFIENLTVRGTAAQGNVLVSNVKAQSITLNSVSLDDGVP